MKTPQCPGLAFYCRVPTSRVPGVHVYQDPGPTSRFLPGIVSTVTRPYPEKAKHTLNRQHTVKPPWPYAAATRGTAVVQSELVGIPTRVL
eukprot:1937045-Rhodomonas_salina.1